MWILLLRWSYFFRLQSSRSRFPSYALILLILFFLFKTTAIQVGALNIKESSIPWVLFFGSILVLQDWANKKFPILIHLRSFSEKLGDLTYSSYLLQYPLILVWLLVCSKIQINLEPNHLPLLLIGYICILFCLSYFTFQKFESHWREKLRI
jgi:peptidoglycan/LPS O-acetylase OafA/YrhL